MEALGGIDVADADHQAAVHQQRLDRRAAPTRCRVQPVAIEIGAQGLDAEAGQQRMRLDPLTFMPEQRPETPRVTQAKNGAGEEQVEVIVRLWRRRRRHQAQAAGHPEVQDQPATAIGALAVEQQILAATADRLDAQAGEARIEAGGNRVPQSGRAHDCASDPLLRQEGEQSLPTDFDFGEFRHCCDHEKSITCANGL